MEELLISRIERVIRELSSREAAETIVRDMGLRDLSDTYVHVLHCEESDKETGGREHWIKGVYLSLDKALALKKELDEFEDFSEVSVDPVVITV